MNLDVAFFFSRKDAGVGIRTSKAAFSDFNSDNGLADLRQYFSWNNTLIYCSSEILTF